MSALEARDITKVFPGCVALESVSIQFESGKVNALVGKNGCGKSTLVKIISGAHQASGGELLINGKVMNFSSPSDAFANGIATVYQELSLIPYLSVAENIFLGRLPTKRNLIDWRKLYLNAQVLLDEMNVDISPRAEVRSLAVWQCQMVEILKAMSANPKVILLDEPTSALATNETNELFKVIRKLKEKDVIVLYITHRLQELWQIADTCTVLRDGHLIGKVSMHDATHKDIIDMMFGDVEIRNRPDNLVYTDEPVLEVNNLTRENCFEDVSFVLKKGEILGIAGMLGSGRSELLRSIFGADKFDSGEIILNGSIIDSITPVKMKKNGLAMTPEDRKNTGLVQIRSVKDNLCIAAIDILGKNEDGKGVFIDRKKEKEFVDKQVNELRIKVPNMELPVSSLSGGNQQKVVVGNWLNTNPNVMLFDEPSRGIDVNAKQQIFQIIWDQSRKGVSCIMVSSELEELLEVCHRILIIRNGRLEGEVLPEKLGIDELYSLCMGELVNE